MLTKRMVIILRMLNQEDGPVSSREICAELGITSRTLRNDIKEVNEIIANHGFRIRSKPGVGYLLEIKDEYLYYDFIKKEMQQSFTNQLLIPNYPEDRVHYIIKKLLIAEDYIKTDDFSDELFVSRSTIDKDMQSVNEKLSFFNLSIENKPYYGIKIVGSEFHRRSCISMYLFSMNDADSFISGTIIEEENHKLVSEILYAVMEEKSFKLTHIGFENLIIHIVIALNRLEKIESYDNDNIDYDLVDTYEFEVAELLSERLEGRFNIKFPFIEKIYIAMHLSGKQASQYLEPSLVITEEYTGLLNRVFKEINEIFNIDLSEDLNLLTSLCLHFEPMRRRITYGLKLENPLLDQIKKENNYAFEISVMMAKILENEWACEISEDEIGYIALHVALSIDNQNREQNKKNILIVCASGVGSSQILYHKVMAQFRDSINTIKVIELYDLNSTDVTGFDLLLTTVPLQKEYGIPIIHVKYFLSDDNVMQINSHFKEKNINDIDKYFNEDLFFENIIAEDSEGIILELSNKVRNLLTLPVDFEEEVIKRERFASTEFGNNVAIPHPMKPITNKTFVAIGILPRPILWDKTYVKYVFLLSISKERAESSSMLYEVLASFTMDKNSLAKFDRSPTMDTFYEILNNLYEKNKENTLDSIFD